MNIINRFLMKEHLFQNEYCWMSVREFIDRHKPIRNWCDDQSWVIVTSLNEKFRSVSRLPDRLLVACAAKDE